MCLCTVHTFAGGTESVYIRTCTCCVVCIHVRTCAHHVTRMNIRTYICTYVCMSQCVYMMYVRMCIIGMM